MKVACENLVRSGVAAALVIRPGLIVGPGDPSGRFTYWPARFAQAAEDGLPVLVPEPVDGPVQLVDVRDLAEWIVTAAEARHHRRLRRRLPAGAPVGAARPGGRRRRGRPGRSSP